MERRLCIGKLRKGLLFRTTDSQCASVRERAYTIPLSFLAFTSAPFMQNRRMMREAPQWLVALLMLALASTALGSLTITNPVEQANRKFIGT